MKAVVDKDTCIGCGLCASICADVFSMDDDGKSVAKDMELTEVVLAEAQDAAMQCPVDAIDVS